ncbi:unnamed protein product, partial [Ectocarpus sp. 12 AP-2014]
GTATELDSGDIVISGLGWSLDIAPGQIVSVGFNGAGSAPGGDALTYSAMIDGQIHAIGPDDVTEEETGTGENPVGGAADDDLDTPEDNAPDSDDAPTGDAANLPDFAWEISSSWDGGFTANIEISNDTALIIEDFSVLIEDPGFSVSNIWGGDAQVLANGDIVISGVSWTQNLSAGGSVTLGFNGDGAVPDDASITYSAVIDGQSYVIG